MREARTFFGGTTGKRRPEKGKDNTLREARGQQIKNDGVPQGNERPGKRYTPHLARSAGNKDNFVPATSPRRPFKIRKSEIGATAFQVFPVLVFQLNSFDFEAYNIFSRKDT